jgi:hypothetical protein
MYLHKYRYRMYGNIRFYLQGTASEHYCLLWILLGAHQLSGHGIRRVWVTLQGTVENTVLGTYVYHFGGDSDK